MDQRPSDVRPALGTDEGDQKIHEIRHDMEETRASLAGKLETLQERVTGSVEQAVGTVQDAVESAKRAVDLRYQTQQRPWLMVGLAFLAGSVVGCMTNRPQRRVAASTEPVRPRRSHAGGSNGHSAERKAAVSSEPEGIFSEELAKLKGVAVGVGMALARNWLKDAAPGLSDQIQQVMDSATRKLGGVPIEGAPFEPALPGSSRFDGLGRT